MPLAYRCPTARCTSTTWYRLTDAGTVLMAGRTTAVDESTVGIDVFESADELAAHAAVMHAELFLLRVATGSVRGPQAT